jgi:beta-N-acetylhexosaminidase
MILQEGTVLNKHTRKMVKKRGVKVIDAKSVFIVLLLVIIILSFLNIAQVKGWFITRQPTVTIDRGVISLDSLNLDQKIAQMLIVQGDINSIQAWKDMQVGGVHLFARQTKDIFREQINQFQENMKVPFFVTVDLEGCVSPFINFRNFTPAADINTLRAAYNKGVEEGEFLKDIGVNLNFAPVVDLEDDIWKCRSFPGNEIKISNLAQSYIEGLQDQGIIATVKHYPGKTLVVRDPHKFIVNAHIDNRDIAPYKFILNDRGEVKSVMVSHIITEGLIDSERVPSVVSTKVIEGIKANYDGLVISDEIHMLGLKRFYGTLDAMYIAVFKAGNDLILNFDSNPNEINRMIQVVKKAVQGREISVEAIDASVTKILEAKGFRVV